MKATITQLAVFSAYALTMFALNYISPFRCRAAYLEGRYGMDHNAAMNAALSEGHEACVISAR